MVIVKSSAVGHVSDVPVLSCSWRDGHVGNVPHDDRNRVHSTGLTLPTIALHSPTQLLQPPFSLEWKRPSSCPPQAVVLVVAP